MNQNEKILVRMAEIGAVFPADDGGQEEDSPENDDPAAKKYTRRNHVNSLLCHGHRAELEEYRSGQAWEESAGAELLLQMICREQGIDVPPEDWQWIRGEHGKPEIPELMPWQFNLTHGGGWTACALACGYSVGVDLQPVGPVREQVARRFFTEWEQEMLGSAENAEESFAIIWAAREAWCKWDGKGITLDPVQNGYRWEIDRDDSCLTAENAGTEQTGEKGALADSRPDSEAILRNDDKLQTEDRVIIWNPGETGNIKGTVWENGHAVCRMSAGIVNGMALAVCGIPVVK